VPHAARKEKKRPDQGLKRIKQTPLKNPPYIAHPKKPPLIPVSFFLPPVKPFLSTLVLAFILTFRSQIRSLSCSGVSIHPISCELFGKEKEKGKKKNQSSTIRKSQLQTMGIRQSRKEFQTTGEGRRGLVTKTAHCHWTRNESLFLSYRVVISRKSVIRGVI
jgi:hypothetical protein